MVQLARQFNAAGVPTPRGLADQWTTVNVRARVRLVRRLLRQEMELADERRYDFKKSPRFASTEAHRRRLRRETRCSTRW